MFELGVPKGETGSFVGENVFGAVPYGELVCLNVGSPAFDFGVGDPKAPGDPFGDEVPKEGVDCPGGVLLKPVPNGEPDCLIDDTPAFFPKSAAFGVDELNALGGPAFDEFTPNGEDFGPLIGVCFAEGLKGAINFFPGAPTELGVDAPNGVFLLEDAVPKGELAALSENFGGGDPKEVAALSFGTAVPNGEARCFPGEDTLGDFANGEAPSFPGNPPVFFGGDPKALAGAADFGELEFLVGSEPKPGRSVEDGTELCLGELTEKFFFVGGVAPKFVVLDDDDGILFSNGFSDVFEDGNPLFFAPAGVPNLGEPGDDDSGDCDADPADVTGGGVTFGCGVLSPNFIDGGA